jgi:transglutaminase-like putative cysteine protease
MSSITLSIHHETVYHYASTAVYSIQRLHMTPRAEPLQRTLEWTITTPGKRRPTYDAFGNAGDIVTLSTPHNEVRITAVGNVEIQAPHAGRISDTLRLPIPVFTVATRLAEPTEAIRMFAASYLSTPKASTAQVLELAAAIRQAVGYQSGATAISSSADDALRLGLGVCQDHAHLFIACCHSVSLPVRYVSGYIYPGEVEHSASHAWVDVWVEDSDYSGWVSIDVTHACLQTADYCRLAVGRDYESVAPVRGMRRGGGDEHMIVRVDVALRK